MFNVEKKPLFLIRTSVFLLYFEKEWSWHDYDLVRAAPRQEIKHRLNLNRRRLRWLMLVAASECKRQYHSHSSAVYPRSKRVGRVFFFFWNQQQTISFFHVSSTLKTRGKKSFSNGGIDFSSRLWRDILFLFFRTRTYAVRSLQMFFVLRDTSDPATVCGL